jgi:hypothetical protein
MSSHTGAGGLHFPATGGGQWRWGLPLGRNRTNHEGVRVRGHWHRAFAVWAAGAQPRLPRACTRDHCLVPTSARRPKRWSQDPGGCLKPWTWMAGQASRDMGGRARDGEDEWAASRWPGARDGAGADGEGTGSRWGRRVGRGGRTGYKWC